MAGWDGAGSIHALRLRVTRLAANGAPAVGANNMYITSALTKISFQGEYLEGDEIEEKNGSGELCLYYQAPDVLKRINVKLEICSPDPELEELLGGGTVLTSAGDTVGLAAPAVGVDPQPNGISIEAWSHAVLNGSIDAELPYIHWVFPKIRNLKPDEKTLANEALKPAYEGFGLENANWGDGPGTAEWPFASNRCWQWARKATVPASAIGYQAVT